MTEAIRRDVVAPHAQPQALRILMVEDSPADADLIRDTLRRARASGFEVEHEVRLTPALERLRVEQFDAVLLDFCLPDCRGLDTYRRVRQASPGMPVIILTNQDDEDTAVTAVREGAQDYILKRQLHPTLLERALRYGIERQAAEEALRESQERYALAVEGARDALWDWNIVSNAVYFSPRWGEMLGRSPNETASSIEDWMQRVHPEDVGLLCRSLNAHLAGKTPRFEAEHRVRQESGEYIWVLCRGIAVRGGDAQTARRMAGSMTDITARKYAEERLLHDAFHDALTGLPNRALFMDRLELAAARARGRAGQEFAILFFDLDRFKGVNDSHGHSVGDGLLVAIAERLLLTLRDGDTLARLGGDEFAILVNDADGVSGAIHAAHRVLEALRQKFIVKGHDVYTSASVGIAISSTGYSRPEDMLRDADTAMYRAKDAGGGRYEVFDRTMHHRAVALLEIETELRRALERQEFLLHYQPIVCLDNGHLEGFEALVRWKHPDGRLIMPGEFIDVAEDTGLSVPLGWWVMDEACRQLRIWQKQFPGGPALAMSVNVSRRLFAEPDMADRVQRTLEATGLSPRHLRLELTENVVMDHGDGVLGKLSALRELGVKLHLDDFGTGYSSLGYLRRFRYDSIKIDRSFVGSLDEGGEAMAIVDTILTLGRNLGVNVIAEGVETTGQLSFLKEQRCPQGQGFLFAPPLDNAAASAYLFSHQV